MHALQDLSYLNGRLDGLIVRNRLTQCVRAIALSLAALLRHCGVQSYKAAKFPFSSALLLESYIRYWNSRWTTHSRIAFLAALWQISVMSAPEYPWVALASISMLTSSATGDCKRREHGRRTAQERKANN